MSKTEEAILEIKKQIEVVHEKAMALVEQNKLKIVKE